MSQASIDTESLRLYHVDNYDESLCDLEEHQAYQLTWSLLTTCMTLDRLIFYRAFVTNVSLSSCVTSHGTDDKAAYPPSMSQWVLFVGGLDALHTRTKEPDASLSIETITKPQIARLLESTLMGLKAQAMVLS
jgi:hypothetical protein